MTFVPTSTIKPMGRALEHAPFKEMLRGYLRPSLALASGIFVASSVINAPEGEKQKTLIQNGLAALGTVIFAIIGANRYLRPDPNHAGALAKYAIEHVGALLPAEAKAARKGWQELHALLEQPAEK